MSTRNPVQSLSVALMLLWAGGCACDPVMVGGLPGDDAGVFDAGLPGPDAGELDAGPPDAGELDAGEPDAGVPDGGEVDAGEVDAGTGVLPVDAGPQTCWSCHGSYNNPAPPRDTRDVTERTARTVGAHQAHLGAESWRRTLLCTDCHRVPATVEEPGHIDPGPAELRFGLVANASNVSSSFDGGTCTTYCHGVSLKGGNHTEPDWMLDPPAACGQCHGLPPPAPHPTVASPFNCTGCHIDIFTQGERHIDGILDLTLGCSSCHGDPTSPAPPKDTLGNTAPSVRGVGAHREHLGDGGPSSWHAQVTCDDCHTVPTRYDDPGHLGPLPAELAYSGTAVARGALPTWNGTSCSNYCHGQTINGGSNRTPAWTTVNGSQAACGTCHSLPPAAPHPANPSCSLCHAAVIAADGGFTDPSLHINGQVESSMACGSCHPVPPATGTHLLHVGTQGSRIYGSLSTAASVTSPTGYAFGCGNCHPTDSSRHLSGGRADIELYNPNAPPGSLKARSPLAQYTPGSTVFTDDAGLPYTQGTCSSVYCHSAPAYSTPNPVPRPGVDFTFAGYPVTYPAFALDVSRSFQAVTWGGPGTGCSGCHGLPIRTAEPQVHAQAGQSHSYIGPGGESGHAWNHGDAPLPCRTCHYDTVTAANATGRVGGVSTYGPVPIVGFAQHVNGLPDVAFDTVDPVITGGRAQSLSTASYSQTTSTCSNVACHKSQTAVKNGLPFRPDESTIECNVCHQY